MASLFIIIPPPPMALPHTPLYVADAAAARTARPALQHAVTFAAISNLFLGSMRGATAADWEALPWHCAGTPTPYVAWKDPTTGALAAPGALPSYTSYRGSSIPENILTAIFVAGAEYRASMFLATSFKRSVAEVFLRAAATAAIPGLCGLRKRVLFEIECPSTRCMHANYIEAGVSMMGGSEAELLFTPYSAFTVIEPRPALTCPRRPEGTSCRMVTSGL